jgi:fused signal recognition particle receptor
VFDFFKRFSKNKDLASSEAPAATVQLTSDSLDLRELPTSPGLTGAQLAPPQSLRERLARTVQALTGSVTALFSGNPKIDDDFLDELETTLITSDCGVAVATRVVTRLREGVRKREFVSARDLLLALRKDLFDILLPVELALWFPPEPKPFVILMVGVNGAGKTTTIGKLAQRLQARGNSVMLAAGDTFRAAAVEQLKEWGARNNVAVIAQSKGAQGQNADSASVVFDAYQSAKAKGVDVLICDTAGRLHTQNNLMQELAKVKRVLGKIDESAPHETLLVIDGSMGQNALIQARQFNQAVGLTGVAITKLDGTAKGGIVFAVADELKLPLRYIGVGEKIEDLREFRAGEFLDTLLPESIAQN